MSDSIIVKAVAIPSGLEGVLAFILIIICLFMVVAFAYAVILGIKFLSLKIGEMEDKRKEK